MTHRTKILATKEFIYSLLATVYEIYVRKGGEEPYCQVAEKPTTLLKIWRVNFRFHKIQYFEADHQL